MYKVTDYGYISDTDAKNLVTGVKDAINSGYEPLGTPMVIPCSDGKSRMVQMIVKRKNDLYISVIKYCLAIALSAVTIGTAIKGVEIIYHKISATCTK